MKTYNSAFLLILVSCLLSCTGPRNIYSSSPFVSPVPLTKGATGIEANYFTHTREQNVPDSLPGNHDNCIGFTISHMLKERTLLFINTDIKKERNQYSDSIPIANDPSYNLHDAGFDSSIVFAKRKTFGAGIEFFPKGNKKTIRSTAISIGIHQLNMNESGLLHRDTYQRFYKINQLSITLQQNFLFNISNSFKLAWISRLTVLNNFEANTDYSSDEMLNAGLRDKRLNTFFGLIGLYAYYQPLQNIPISVTTQFFNDVWLKKHSMANYELGEVHVKGTGVSVGITYVFK